MQQLFRFADAHSATVKQRFRLRTLRYTHAGGNMPPKKKGRGSPLAGPAPPWPGTAENKGGGKSKKGGTTQLEPFSPPAAATAEAGDVGSGESLAGVLRRRSVRASEREVVSIKR